MNLKIIIYKFLKSDFLRNSSILISGTVLAQLIPILLQPYLRRQYSPDIFGTYTVYLSLIGILFTITSFRYELAIVLPKRDKEAINVFTLSQIFNLVISVVIFIIILLFKDSLLTFLNIHQKHILFLLLIPLSTFLYNLYTAINFWLIRNKAFYSISTNKIVRRGTEGIFQSGFTIFKINSGLLFGDILGHFANILSGFRQIHKNNFNLQYVSIEKLKYVRRKYIEYPRYNLIPTFMSACSYLLPALIINKYFSSEYAGYYDLSKLLLSIPLALIATSISNVLLQQLSEKYRNNKSIKKEVKTMLAIVLPIVLLEITIVSLWSKQIFSIAFGDQWDTAATISRIMVWSYALNFITTSFSGVFIAIKRIKLLSVWQVCYFAAICSLFLFKLQDFNSFIKIFVLIEVCCYIVYIFLLVKSILTFEKKIKIFDSHE